MSNGGLRALNQWWRYWIGNETVQPGRLVRAQQAVLAALRDLKAVDAEMIETRSFDQEIGELEMRMRLLTTTMIQTARVEFDERRARIRRGDRAAVPAVLGEDA